MEKEEWIKRCAAEFDRCAKDDKANWRDAAEICYEEAHDDFPDDPEYAANEEMSYWDDDE